MSKIQKFDYSVDLLRAILWQYNDALKLQSILEQKQEWYTANQSEFWSDWYVDVFDLRTANNFGLAVWSIILDIPLGVDVGEDDTRPSYGFGPFHLNYNNGNFARSSSSFIRLSAEQKRIVLQLRYIQLVSRGTIPEVNMFLQRLFQSEGNAYVLDGLDMTAVYVFDFVPSSELQFIFDFYDVLPRPAGVGVSVRTISKITWGFGIHHVNYNNGNYP